GLVGHRDSPDAVGGAAGGSVPPIELGFEVLSQFLSVRTRRTPRGQRGEDGCSQKNSGDVAHKAPCCRSGSCPGRLAVPAKLTAGPEKLSSLVLFCQVLFPHVLSPNTQGGSQPSHLNRATTVPTHEAEYLRGRRRSHVQRLLMQDGCRA